MKVFQVIHVYDIYGGFGDAVERQEVIEVFENFNDAVAFMEKFRNVHVYDVYDKPYAELQCGFLKVCETEIVSHKDFDINKFSAKDYWWTEEYRAYQRVCSFAWDLHEALSAQKDENGRTIAEEFIGGEEYDPGTAIDSILHDIYTSAEKAGVPWASVVEAEKEIAHD